jgi:hypothetical protein
MAGPGRTPKDPSRRHRNPQGPTPPGEIDEKQLRGPDLPPLADEEDWHPVTQKWWLSWRRSDQAGSFAETDWDFLLDTALMHNAMWSRGRWEFAAEVRLRVAKFGATLDDRRRLQMDAPRSDPVESSASRTAKVTDIASRRRRLSG